MKRSLALEPFSRDHNVGLTLARHLSKSQEGAVEEFLTAWQGDLQDHFDEEERILGQLAGKLQGQMISEHDEIRALVAGLPGTALLLGEAMERHIRWEERTLFPYIEENLTGEQAKNLQSITFELEQRRWEHNPERERDVKRRIERLTSSEQGD